ncbi:hypothetical protein A1Q2_01847 [Trichosporon asahii var. asahii CBS 8904]|uniref:Thiamine-binding protein domain-containing protein n=1 Tax=Trichosporon asahii var. asahii (strain CBS 8904) TaxID=1220162 RepID=K1WS61_TRIAC|nr:hypothetical protein A1Q2_01847 [Trichosporon asahii var. asahii CBS 8904]
MAPPTAAFTLRQPVLPPPVPLLPHPPAHYPPHPVPHAPPGSLHCPPPVPLPPNRPARPGLRLPPVAMKSTEPVAASQPTPGAKPTLICDGHDTTGENRNRDVAGGARSAACTLPIGPTMGTRGSTVGPEPRRYLSSNLVRRGDCMSEKAGGCTPGVMYSNLQKPTMSEELYAVADFCLIPMGTESPSVGPQIAECQRVLEKSGLEYNYVFAID